MVRTTFSGLPLAGILIAWISGSASASDRPTTGRDPEVWALVIGVEGYGDRAIPACRGSIREGSEFALWFTGTARQSPDHLLLMNERGAPGHGRPGDSLSNLLPTRENLRWASESWIGHRAREGDVVVIYFAGQAVTTLEGGNLLPLDARADDAVNTGWSPEGAVDELAGRLHCTVVLWLDTSPLGRGRPVLAQPVDPSAGLRMLDRLTRWPGVTAWMAADGHPAAEGIGRSPFAEALQVGLGTRPGTLQACLHRMRQDEALARQGFRVRGGLPPSLTLWASHLLPAHRFQPQLLLQHGHADAVTSLGIVPDCERLITAGLDSTIRVWRMRDRALMGVLTGHLNGVTALALAADGRSLASGDGMGELRVWDLAEHRSRSREGPSPHDRGVVSLSFFPDGERLVSLDLNGRCELWDTTGPVIRPVTLIRSRAVLISAAIVDGPVAVALAENDGQIRLLGNDGAPRPVLAATGKRPTALHLSPDGRRLAVGDADGRVRVWDVASRAIAFQCDYPGKVVALRFGPGGRLAVGAGDELYLVEKGRAGPGFLLKEVVDEVDSTSFSADGRWLLARVARGDLHLWELGDEANPAPRPATIEPSPFGLTSATIAPDGRSLVAGEGDGGIRSWDLPELRERPRIAPHRGKVDDLSVSADGCHLLQITHDGTAFVWDLQEGRGARAIEGLWASGAFLPDGRRLAMIRDADEGGDVVLVDRTTGRPLRVLERPLDLAGAPAQADFGRIVVARDGRRIAAVAAPGRGEFACVWDVEGGRPNSFHCHDRLLTSLDLSADGRLLLTASEDGTARLWELAPRLQDPRRPLVVIRAPEGRMITAARLSPVAPRRLVTADWSAGRLGRVYLWDHKPGQEPRPIPLGAFNGRVHAVCFTSDGRWVAAAGQDRSVRVWDLAGEPPRQVLFDPERQHVEQINALIAWPGIPMIVSGGDDTTVRFWRLDHANRHGVLLGTLSAAVDDRGARGRVPAAPRGVEWVAYTPEGVHDGSLGGDHMVTFTLGQDVRPLEQYAGRFYNVRLTDELRRGEQPEALPASEPSRLVIDPPARRDVADRDIELQIACAGTGIGADSLRLYHNGSPVSQESEFRALEGGRFATHARLRRGLNRFYVMAGGRDDVDARSPDLDVTYDGEETPGRLHVLALGVSHYRRKALRFADRDADQIADFLHRLGTRGSGAPGLKIVLTNEEVTEKRVEEAFDKIRDAVRTRPEDTVVLFLAGHTAVLGDEFGRDRFSLLLPNFPFPADEPLLADLRGVRLGGAGQGRPAGIDLPFYVLYRNLVRIKALQRLIIVDACQTEAIYDDPGVRLIREMMESGSHQVRTSYLLATRRGEPATESPALEHGLLTYVLLRGMQATGLKPLPVRLPILEEQRSADRNGDGIITTQELREFAERVLPELAGVFPDLARRSGPGEPASPPQSARIHAAETSFPLVVLP